MASADTITLSRRPNHKLPGIQATPLTATVTGAPDRAAKLPASKLPNGVIPWNAIE